MNYSEITLDQLFDSLREASLMEFNARGMEGLPAQARAVDLLDTIQTEIARRPESVDRYREMLKDPHPCFRLSAAYGLKKADPAAAAATFKELSKSNSEGGIPSKALLEVFAFRKMGYSV